MASSQCDSYLHFSQTSSNFTTSGRPSGCERKRADYNRIWFNSQLSLASNLFVWLLTYSAFLLPHNTASTLSEPGQSLIRFGCAPGSENELISLAAPAVLWASACPRHPGLGLGCPVVSKGCEASREWPSCCLRTTVSP